MCLFDTCNYSGRQKHRLLFRGLQTISHANPEHLSGAVMSTIAGAQIHVKLRSGT